MTDIRLTGVEGLRAKLRVARGLVVQEVARALLEDAEETMAISKRDFVPVDQGILRGSGHVAGPDIGANKVTVTLGYGGAASAYALVQHERTDFNHPRGGQAKYLERPFFQRAAGLDQRVSGQVRGRIETRLAD